MFAKVFATDLDSDRLKVAEKYGAIALPGDKLDEALSRATQGRGADAVLELVGVSKALESALELVRPYGVISSGGVYTADVNLPGSALYAKKYVVFIHMVSCSASLIIT